MSNIIYSKLGSVPAKSRLRHPRFLQSPQPTFEKIKPPTAEDFAPTLTFRTHKTVERIQATLTEVSTTEQEVNSLYFVEFELKQDINMRDRWLREKMMNCEHNHFIFK